MHLSDGQLFLSATDVASHLACKHLTQLDRGVAEGRIKAVFWADPALDLLRERGRQHEAAYVESLRAQGLAIVEIDQHAGAESLQRTLDAMRAGTDVIVQAALQDRRWRGRIDVLLKVATPSNLGLWSYEVVDTKLAQETKAGTILQLCLYSDLLTTIQGLVPERMHVVKPGIGLPRETFRYPEFQAYYRLIRKQLEAAVADGPVPVTYPSPVTHCEICSWWRDCSTRRRADDHLCLVAGIRKLQIKELHRQQITSLTQFAEQTKPLREPPERGALGSYAIAHAQAGVQLRGRRESKLLYELLPPEPSRGFQRLPAPSVGDVFIDFEADPFVQEGGLEYLLGCSSTDATATTHYVADWAVNRAAEKRMLERFIDFVMRRWCDDPNMHVYHYSPYEPAALKRLMGRHATREVEMDRLLRGGRFVDLHAVARQALRASVESYSLKELERFCDFQRAVELPVASAALYRIQFALEFDQATTITPEDRAIVEGYNRDDCLATSAFRDWLEARRQECEGQGHALPRPPSDDGQASETIEQRDAAVQAVFDRLVGDLQEERSCWSSEDRARWLLAHLLDYFRREDRCAWWEFFRLLDLEPEQLLDERKAIAGLVFQEETGGTAKCPIHRYCFPFQEIGLDGGETLYGPTGEAVGTVEAIDPVKGILDIKKRAAAVDAHHSSVVANDYVNPHPLPGSVLDLGREIAEHGFTSDRRFQAGRDLLRKERPRMRGGARFACNQGESASDAAIRLVTQLDRGVLPIQGPPGAGKTHTGAAMIVELVRAGMRVGVTAVSHRVIRNLLARVLDTAKKLRVQLSAVHKAPSESGEQIDGLEEADDNQGALAAAKAGKVVGATAWLWARDDAIEAVDYLFIDEAGQMSLAQALAASRSAHNLVMLGDLQQLQQPQRGSHPEGAEISALDHLLDGRDTIAEDRGLFLDQTWRLHPAICQFTSELYYEGRLQARPENRQQELIGNSPFAGSGLFYVPVEHEGSQNCSTEEVDAVGHLFEHMVGSKLRWMDAEKRIQGLEPNDILIVAPYNAQVGALAKRLPGARVGTVDKFQGQEAAVVIFSLASSSAEDAPRGMEFLYDPHRLNVATSRARCASIIVASPRLFEPECRSPDQMRRANGLCRFREFATVVSITAIPR